MRTITFVIGLTLVSSWAAGGLDLSAYRFAGRFPLPDPDASEASTVTYNWDTDTLFVLGDEGGAVVEVRRDGTRVGAMGLVGFDDTEGLAYVGGGAFVLVEERLQDASRFTYTAGGSVSRSSIQSVSLGDTVGNIGLEGIAYDRPTGNFIVVKEKTPQRVARAAIDFAAGTASVTDLYAPNFGTLDLADVATLSSVPSLAGDPDAANLLIFSQESSRLLEVSPAGAVLSQFDFSALAGNAEGVTIDNAGTIYVVGEDPALYVLTPVPEPSSGAVCVAAVAAAGLRWRRRRRGR